MTLSIAPDDLDVVTTTAPERSHPQDRRCWAVVEILHDGTLGRTELVTARGASQAAAVRSLALGPADLPELTTQVGVQQAADGQLHKARQTLLGALRSSTTAAARASVLGPLALVEAYRGDLHDAETHADVCLAFEDPNSLGAVHARAAKAWVHLGRAELEDAQEWLDIVHESLGDSPGPWLAAALALVEAGVRLAAHQPDAATRLLAEASDVGAAARFPSWVCGILTAARAESLLAANEPRRALAAVTPLPEHAVVEASVTAAAARRDIGDARGASAVLASVTEALEGSPLPLQVRAKILEARLADERGQRERAWLLVDRALRWAASEGMRSALRSDWRWLRAFLDREPQLKHRHREFVLHLDAMDVPRASQQDLAPGAALTPRESEVLELLAQMYSTEEIARTLYVSSNTVKTHVKGIFGKLSVNRRVDAVRRGRQLGQC